jgi:hypothetical protein
MYDRLRSGHHFGIRPEWLSGVGIPIKARGIAAGNVDANSVPELDLIAGHPQVDFERLDLSGFEWHRFIHPVAVPRAQDAFAQVISLPVGIYVEQLSCEISIPGA